MSDFRGYLDRARRFLVRNWGSITVGAIAVPTFLRLTEIASQRYITYTTERTHQMLLRFKKQRMFEMMEETFPESFKTWHSLMKQSIKEVINAEKHMEMLKQRKGNKMDHWLELKVYAFTTVNVLVFGSSLLSILLRIQTNVISGLLFKQMEYIPAGLEELGQGDGSPHIGVITESVQQEYMKLTRYLCTTGIKRMCVSMFDKTYKALENLQLKHKLTVADVDRYLINACKASRSFQPIHQELEIDIANDRNDWCPIKEAWFYMIDMEDTKELFCGSSQTQIHETNTDVLLRNLLGEAYDLVRSKDTVKLLKYLEINGRNNYLDRIAEFVNSLPPNLTTDATNSEDGLTLEAESEFAAQAVYVAKLIPFMNSLIDVPFEDDSWIDILLKNSSLKTFSANIYESYSDKCLNQL